MLLDLGDPRLRYSLFESQGPRIAEPAGRLLLRLTGNPRLPRTRDHAWTNLLLIGSAPNFASLDYTRGLTPFTVLHPLRTAEPMRWALHSLCQATIEAVTPPPIWLRNAQALLSRPLRPPLRNHPWTLPSVLTVNPDPLHPGVPCTSPWTFRRPLVTYGTFRSSLQTGLTLSLWPVTPPLLLPIYE